MNDLTLIASATGLGFLAGIRLYATVLTLSLAIKLGWLELSPQFSQLERLGNWWVVGISAAAFTIEFFADKIPWVDSLWDSVHTFIRPVGATVLAVTAVGDVDPVVQATAGILAGSVALAGHSTKAATRWFVNSSPEPVSNIALSLAGDMAVPAGVWFVLNYPWIAAGFIGMFLLLFAVISPGVFRLLRVQVRALVSLLRSSIDSSPRDAAAIGETPDISARRSEGGLGERLDARLAEFLIPLPEPHCGVLMDRLRLGRRPHSLEAVAAYGMAGLRNSIGYVCFTDDSLVFVTRRWFRHRIRSLPLAEVRVVRFRKRLLLDRIEVEAANSVWRLDVFREQSGRGESLANVFSADTAEA
ncbi:MAG: DUF4126 domain-containing protein [Acidobacteria bacterium]|nr:DUF4126 domain-containing protein [Acidobacteriota bacterium]